MKFRNLAGGLALMMLSGCGTIAARGEYSWTNDDYFKSTQGNIKLLTGNLEHTGYFPATVFCWLSVACPITAIITLPVDAAVDVVMLPVDYGAAPK